jgi:arylmalonate decarboxylase
MTLDTTPIIGLIVPPAADQVPFDAATLYAGRARFIARGLGISGISPVGFNPVIDKVVDKALELRDAGAQVISLMGTSISFYRGAAFTEDIRTAMQEATGLPCSTMSHAVIASLHELGIRRVAVATSYVGELNDGLVQYLNASGFEVAAIQGLSITDVEETSQVNTQVLIDLCEEVITKGGQSDGIFISCGGLMTLDAIKALECKLCLPVTASSPAGFWDVMRLAGQDPHTPGFGRLFNRKVDLLNSRP